MTKKSNARRARIQPNRSFPFQFSWSFMGDLFRSAVLPTPCQFCQAVAIIALPESIRAAQQDGTTHVCHPSAGGCNHGFALETENQESGEDQDDDHVCDGVHACDCGA